MKINHVKSFSTSSINESFKFTSIFVAAGFFMTLGMAALTVINPEGGQYHTPVAPTSIASEIASFTDLNRSLQLLGIVLDSFFIIGYIAVFYGLYLYVKDSDMIFPILGLVFGIFTGIFDLLENALHIALITGIPNWIPNDLTYTFLWLFTFIKDLSSYLSGFIFIILLLLTLNRPQVLRNSKLLLIILTGFYVIVGSIGILLPSFLLIRNLGFVIDLAVAAILFYRTSKLELN